MDKKYFLPYLPLGDLGATYVSKSANSQWYESKKKKKFKPKNSCQTTLDRSMANENSDCLCRPCVHVCMPLSEKVLDSNTYTLDASLAAKLVFVGICFVLVLEDMMSACCSFIWRDSLHSEPSCLVLLLHGDGDRNPLRLG